MLLHNKKKMMQFMMMHQDEYLDPITSLLMVDPVMLPSSRQILDRATIARHLLRV